MKENVLEVLMYLFENVVTDATDLPPAEDEVVEELEHAGFRVGEINKALKWLNDLISLENKTLELPQNGHRSLRVYDTNECDKLDAECRGLLLYLEQMGVIDPVSRELIVDRLMALEAEHINIEEAKWVTLLVLFNRPGLEAEFAWMEEFVYEGVKGVLH